jgi:hypothetical protein
MAHFQQKGPRTMIQVSLIDNRHLKIIRLNRVFEENNINIVFVISTQRAYYVF